MIRLPQHIDLLPNGCIIPCTEESCTNILFSLRMHLEGGNIFFDYFNPNNEEELIDLITSSVEISEQRKEFLIIMNKLMNSNFKTTIRYTTKLKTQDYSKQKDDASKNLPTN